MRAFDGYVLEPASTGPVPGKLLEHGSAAELRALVGDGTFVPEAPGFLVHRVSEGERVLAGVVVEIALEDYVRGAIKPHEAVRQELVDELAAHREAVAAETTPVLAAYRSVPRLDALVAEVTESRPLVDVEVGSARQALWRVPALHRDALERELAALSALYIIDGHHRVEAACRIAEHGHLTGHRVARARDHFLAVLVPAGELHVAPYHRWVRDLGAGADELLGRLRERFEVEPAGPTAAGAEPRRRGEFAMYLDGTWHRVSAGTDDAPDGAAALDVMRLQDAVLGPILGIRNPDSDARMEFVAGPEGLDALERRCQEAGGVAFALHPADVDEVLAAADAGDVLPPKSTWFGPKPEPGLLLRLLDDEPDHVV